MADHLIMDPRVLDPWDIRPYTSLENVRAELENFHGRGAAAATSALGLSRQGAESRPETQLRLLLARAGLPEPELQAEIRSGNRLLGFVDLFYRDYGVIVEYDGDGHRTNARQYDRDIARIDDLIEANYTVIRVRKRGLYDTPDYTIARVTRALSARGWAPKARKSR
jgi:very-short-patch-repair endonuclease